MSNPHELNPYAPSQLVGESLRSDRLIPKQVPTVGLLAATFGGIVLSGAAFGMILATIIALAEPSNVLEVVMLVPLGIVAGGVTAGLSATPTVIVSLCLSAPLVPLAKGWESHQARNFALICGFLSGSLPIILVDTSDPYTWLFAFVPGTFGALGTGLFVRWIFGVARRRAGSDANRTLVERSGNNVT